jgi:hypothetical protein
MIELLINQTELGVSYFSGTKVNNLNVHSYEINLKFMENYIIIRK